jgi:hypothetical protein
MKRKGAINLLISVLLVGTPVSTGFSAVTKGPHKIVGIDEKTHSFTVWSNNKNSHSKMRGSSREEIYKVTEKTTYVFGGNKGSWGDVRKGLWVRIEFEPGPRLNVYLTPHLVADTVYISNDPLQ